MSIYDEIEARADQQEESRRKRILAVVLLAVTVLAIGVRLWLIRPPPPPSSTRSTSLAGCHRPASSSPTGC